MEDFGVHTRTPRVVYRLIESLISQQTIDRDYRVLFDIN